MPSEVGSGHVPGEAPRPCPSVQQSQMWLTFQPFFWCPRPPHSQSDARPYVDQLEHIVASFLYGNSTLQILRKYFSILFWTQPAVSPCCMSFSDTDRVPPSHFHVTTQPENDNICLVLPGKGRGSQAKKPKSSPSGTHSGPSSVAHLL